MKKVLSIVLAGVLVFGMSLTAFAAWDGGVGFDGTAVQSSTTATVGGSVTFTLNFADIVPDETKVLLTDTVDKWSTIRADYASTTPLTVTVTPASGMPFTQSVAVANPTVTASKITWTIPVPSRAAAGDTITATDTFTATGVITYKWDNLGTVTTATGDLAIELDLDADVVAKGTTTDPDVDPDPDVTTGSIIQTGWKITGINTDYPWSEKDVLDAVTNVVDGIGPDSTVSIRLDPEMFKWEDSKGNVINNKNIKVLSTGLTESLLKRYRVDAARTVTSGSTWLKSVVIENISISTANSRAHLRVKFIKEFVTTKEPDFDAKVYLSWKGSRVSGTEMRVTGIIKNEINEAETDDDYVEANGAVVKALDSIRKVRIDGGLDVIAVANLNNGAKYYFKANDDITDADDTLMSKYRAIDTVYYVNQIGLNNANVFLEGLSDNMYIYDQDGNYLGRSNDSAGLKMAKKYYIATERINLSTGTTDDDDDDNGDDGDEIYVDPPATGGDDVVANANNNPGTGVNGFANVAVVAGVIALAAAGAVALKK